jgi:hypothetical protein
MTIFAMFSMLNFIAGIVLWRYGFKGRVFAAFLIAVYFAVVYFFFNKI